MALFTLATDEQLVEVLGGSLTMPLEGAWVANLELGEDEAPQRGAAVLQIAREEGEPDRFTGTIVSSDIFEGRAHVELVAGAGGLASGSTAVHYTAAPTRVAAADLVAAIVAGAGEQLAEGVKAGLAGLTAARWTRVAWETWAASLRRVAERYGLAWRLLDTGAVWVGEETWPETIEAPFLVDDDLRARVMHVAFDTATWRPGTTVLGRRVSRVTYWQDGTAELEYEESDVELLRQLVARLSKPSPYALIYAAEVVAQNADGTLDLRVLDGPIADLPGVPFLTGLEGGRYVVAAGAIVRVAFIGAALDGAFAFARASDDSASRGVARVRDIVDCGQLAVEMVGGAPAFSYNPPPGSGAVPVIRASTVALKGVVSTGSEEVFLR